MLSNLEIRKPIKRKSWSFLVVVKGAGDLATGVAHRLHRAGMRVIMTELPEPTVIRRTVAFAEAVFEGKTEVEGIVAQRASNADEALALLDQGVIPVLVDPQGLIVRAVGADVVVDAIIAKRNTGTSINDAPVVIGLGPGFCAGKDVHAVVETNRGHNLGRVILEGEAEPNTGVPGEIGGFGAERVVRAPVEGIFYSERRIGDLVNKGEAVAFVRDAHGELHPVYAGISGVIRGLLRDGIKVFPGMKSGDIDPRAKREYCFTISDKARAVAGGVMEAILMLS